MITIKILVEIFLCILAYTLGARIGTYLSKHFPLKRRKKKNE